MLHKNVSQIFAIADFSSTEITRKTLSGRKDITGNTNLGQASHLNVDKFGVGNDIRDCRSSPCTIPMNYIGLLAPARFYASSSSASEHILANYQFYSGTFPHGVGEGS